MVLNVAFGQPTIAVDTHIFRVANRTGLAPGSDVAEVERKLVKFTPQEFLHDAHHWLILHGRYVCQARKPDCPQCVIADLCEYRHKTTSTGCGRVARNDPQPGCGHVILWRRQVVGHTLCAVNPAPQLESPSSRHRESRHVDSSRRRGRDLPWVC